MPRLKQSPTEQQNSHILATIGFYQNLYGLSDEELYLAARVGKDTWRSRKNSPEKFKVGELYGLAKKFRIPITEFFEVGKKL